MPIIMMNKPDLIIIGIIAILAAGCITPGGHEIVPDQPKAGSLYVYSGAGLKAPMLEIGETFQNMTGVRVEYNFQGSGALISQMELSRKGDVFIPGGTPDYTAAQNRSLVTEPRYIAYHIPVIAMKKGNPKNITSINDFTKDGVRLALGDPSATAIGKSTVKLLKGHGITEAVEKNVVTRGATNQELVTAVVMGTADATITTLDMINPETMDFIPIPVEENLALIIPIGTTTFTDQETLARMFVDFVASDRGKAIFVRHGFPSYPDPLYAGVTP
ncbi:MAG TPA: molybdate ABC transporter substrate-binding protein [Methanoregulaceae archaeon]|nr:molybdate ABC transporter substrate-binding protein [Methanoregulaceae archaeon]